MEIISFNRIDSTQKYLIEAIKDKRVFAPVAVIASEQLNGVGSRGNRWEGGLGNLYTSIAIKISSLPKDLPLISASIYFGWIMKELLYKYNNRVWLKWPNDIYLDEYKIGGVVTSRVLDTFIVGIGINMKKNSNSYMAIELNKEPIALLKEYLKALEEKPLWKSIFSKYRLEFEKSRAYMSHFNGKRIGLDDVILCEDGTLIKNGERIVNLR